MARLFITPREIDLISDITKEVMKDVVGQKVYYYRVREEYSEIHDVYEESPEKIFDPAIEIDALIEWDSSKVSTNNFGTEKYQKIVVYIQHRDMMDKNIEIREGDYLSYGTNFFELTTVEDDSLVYGQIEYSTGYRITCTQARIGQIDKQPHGPTSTDFSDPDAVQETFVQQRGLPANRLGPTGDVRALIEEGKLDPPEVPAEVSKRGDPKPVKSTFYDE
tara:strand:+ start:409 stop:1068 length:660 start_codon:yes stop_codon:yes gene_type:complete